MHGKIDSSEKRRPEDEDSESDKLSSIRDEEKELQMNEYDNDENIECGEGDENQKYQEFEIFRSGKENKTTRFSFVNLLRPISAFKELFISKLFQVFAKRSWSRYLRTQLIIVNSFNDIIGVEINRK